MYPFLKKLFADGGYQGPEFHTALTKFLPQLETEIIKRSDHAQGFVGSFPATAGCRAHHTPGSTAAEGLPRIGENLDCKALAFLRLASIRLMLRKLCNPA